VFVDGVHPAEQEAYDKDLLDLERVEVINGPQSSLFGYSSFAGAIRYYLGHPLLTLSGAIGSMRAVMPGAAYRDGGPDLSKTAAGRAGWPLPCGVPTAPFGNVNPMRWAASSAARSPWA